MFILVIVVYYAFFYQIDFMPQKRDSAGNYNVLNYL